MVAFNRVATYSSANDVVPTGFGRWLSILLNGKDGHKTRILAAYISCKSQGGQYATVYTQHRRCIRIQNDHIFPRKVAQKDLLRAIKTQNTKNKQIIM